MGGRREGAVGGVGRGQEVEGGEGEGLCSFLLLLEEGGLLRGYITHITTHLQATTWGEYIGDVGQKVGSRRRWRKRRRIWCKLLFSFPWSRRPLQRSPLPFLFSWKRIDGSNAAVYTIKILCASLLAFQLELHSVSIDGNVIVALYLSRCVSLHHPKKREPNV